MLNYNLSLDDARMLLVEELKPKKINVLAVCPGPMNTEFLDVAGISGGKSKTFETLPYCDPKKVAFTSLDKAAKEIGVDFIGGYSALVHKLVVGILQPIVTLGVFKVDSELHFSVHLFVLRQLSFL